MITVRVIVVTTVLRLYPMAAGLSPPSPSIPQAWWMMTTDAAATGEGEGMVKEIETGEEEEEEEEGFGTVTGMGVVQRQTESFLSRM